MAMTVHCDIVSAEENIFSGLVETVVCEGEMGELGVKPSHAPLLTRLNPAPVRLILQNGSEKAKADAEKVIASKIAEEEFAVVAADLARASAQLRTLRELKRLRGKK